MYDYYAIVPHVTKPQLCLLFENDRWYLPQWQSNQRRFWQNVDQVNQEIRGHFGIDVTTLRCLGTDSDMDTGHIWRAYEFENRSPAWSPPGRGRWVARDALDALPLGQSEQRPMLDAWFSEIEQGTPSRRRLWARRGWFDATTNWVRDQLRMQGITFVQMEQLRTWERACVLRAETDAGAMFLHAVPAMFAQELPLTRGLASWYPRNFPHFIAEEPDRRWMLLQGLDGEPLEKVRDIALWEHALRRYAEIQIGLALRKQDLIDLGCPDRPTDMLATDFAALIDDDVALMRDTMWGLTEMEAQTLRAFVPAIQMLVDHLATHDIPMTLEHGDFWAGNITWSGDGPLYSNLSNASVTHPFFSLALFMEDAIETLHAIPDARERLRDAYLQPWALYKSQDSLRDAFAMAAILGPLHHAISYYRYILPRMETRWELERMVPFYLKMMLRSLHEADNGPMVRRALDRPSVDDEGA